MNNHGLNGNMVGGLVSSRISYYDYQNCYQYIYVDLSRRQPDAEFVSQALTVQGTLLSRDMVFHCYVTKQKTMALDVMTGARLQLDASQSAIV